jgi:drug/metabolite transporter (DMT)-like permease
MINTQLFLSAIIKHFDAMSSEDKSPSNFESQSIKKSNPHHVGELILILTTIIWGTSFIITKTIIEIVPSNFYMGIRFLIGAAFFIPFMVKYKHYTRKFIKISFIAGFIYWVSNFTQTIGLQTTTASKSGFLTGLNVIMVPIFLYILFRKRISKVIWIAGILATIGTTFLTGILTGNFDSFVIGDFLTLICAVFCAFYIIYLDRNSSDTDYMVFSGLQLLFISLFSFISAFLFDEYSIISADIMVIFSFNNIIAWVYMGIIVTSLTFLFQVYGQARLSATKSAIIFALEPVFATFFAMVIGNETLTAATIIGAIFILTGILIYELYPEKKIEK